MEILLLVGTASFLSSLDLFVVNLAFSSMRESFPGATNRSLSWVLGAYSISFAALLVPSGRLADRHGRARVFRLGLALFGVASAACALAPTVPLLVVARAVKGIGAAMMVPTSLGLLLAAYPRERHTQVVSIWAATGSVAAALGPVLGGALVHVDWRLVFLINLPVCAVATWRSRLLTSERRGLAAGPDLVGSGLFALGVGALVLAISEAPEWRAGPRLFGTLLASCVLLAWFVRRCQTVASPALDLRLFRSSAFTAATLGMGCFYVGFAMMLLGGTLFLTTVWRWDTLRAGAGFAFGPGAAVVASIVAGRLRVSPIRATRLGAVLFVLAAVWWLVALGETQRWLLAYLPGSLLFGAAAGLSQMGFLTGGAAALEAADYATGAAVLNTSRQIGGAVGVALFVALSGTATAASQYVPAWCAMIALGVVSGLCSAVRVPTRTPLVA